MPAVVTTLAPRARRRMVPPPPPDAVTRYALDVVGGRVVAGELVRMACERHLSDLATGAERGLHFDVAAADHAIAFFPLLRHYQGEWGPRPGHPEGDPVVLEPWQKFVVGSAFGWKRADGTRRFREVYLEVAKKNGKTLMAAGVALLLAFFDGEPGAQVYSLATKRDQAKLVWTDAKQMVTASPELAGWIRTYALSIADDSTASFFRPLGRDSGEGDQGVNAHGAVVDELHVIEDRDSLTNIETAMSSRRQPMLWKITTAGKKRAVSVWANERADAKAVVEGRATDDSMLVLIYTLDEGDDHFDEAVWPKSNPNLGVSVKLDTLRSDAAKAQRSPARLAGYLQLRMNLPTKQGVKAVDLKVWDACSGRPDDEEYAAWVERIMPVGMAGYAGLDLASVRDLTAFLLVFRDDEGYLDLLPLFWCPEVGIEERSRSDGVPYDEWQRDGWLLSTPGNVTDYDAIRRAVTGTYQEGDRVVHDDACLADRYRIMEVGHDRWNATQLATHLAGDGLECFAIPQTFAGLGPGWNELERAMLQGKLRHGGHPVLRWMAANLELETDAVGNVKPSKRLSSERIDGISAGCMGVARLITHLDERDDSEDFFIAVSGGAGA